MELKEIIAEELDRREALRRLRWDDERERLRAAFEIAYRPNDQWMSGPRHWSTLEFVRRTIRFLWEARKRDRGPFDLTVRTVQPAEESPPAPR